jgi:hypothetical protein
LRHRQSHPFGCLAATGTEMRFDAHYPINFVVKHQNPARVIEWARPQAMGNLPKQSRKTEQPVSKSASPAVAAIGKQ